MSLSPANPPQPVLARLPRVYALALYGAMAIALAWELPRLGSPPHGQHAWRDADGVGIARSFLHEGWNILYPRVAERGGTSGIVGMEFPALNWLGAAAMKLAGEHDFWARFPVWLCLIPLALGARLLGRRLLQDDAAACIAAAFLVLQPLIVVFSRKLMPEIPMVMLLVWGLVFAYDGLRGSWVRTLAGAVFFTLAAVLKPTGFAVGLPVAVWGVQALRRTPGPWTQKWTVVLRAALLAGIPAVAVFVWFSHSRALNEAHGLQMFKIHHDWLQWTHVFFTLNFQGAVMGRALHLFLLWPTVLWMAWRWRAFVETVRSYRLLAAWFVASLAVVVLFGSKNFHHSYYAMPLTLPTAFLTAAFVTTATRDLRSPERARIAFLVVIAATVLVRTRYAFPPLDFDAHKVKLAAQQLGPPGLAVVTDQRTPVVSLVVLRRNGWSAKAQDLTPEYLADAQRMGAKVLVESSFGGWLSDAQRGKLPPPYFQDAQIRSYVLSPP